MRGMGVWKCYHPVTVTPNTTRPPLPRAVADWLGGFCAWALAEGSVDSVALVGSYARGTQRPNSDIDLVIVAIGPMPYIQDTAWTRQFGRVRDIAHEDWGAVQSIRVFYADGLE